MKDKNSQQRLDELDADQRQSRSVSPMRNRGATKQANRSTRSSAKRSKRKANQGGIHQRRNKRSNW